MSINMISTEIVRIRDGKLIPYDESMQINH